MIPSFPEELAGSITSVEDPLQTAYTIANFQRMDIKDSQEILELDSVAEKLKKLIGLLVREAEVLQLGQKIQNEARGEIEKVQREYFLREQMKAIQSELGKKMNRLLKQKSSAKRSKMRKCLKKPRSRLDENWSDYRVCRQRRRSMASSELILIGLFRCRGQNDRRQS